MYYISKVDQNLAISVMVKTLSKFRGINGEKYHVRNRRDVGAWEAVPIYVYEKDKLNKTDDTAVFNVFGGR